MLEVGLGGRLDAVNIIDADVAIITTVDLDHIDWLGPDRDSIGREKAGIARAGRPAIVGELDPPQGLLHALARHAARGCSGPAWTSASNAASTAGAGGIATASAWHLPDPPALAAPVQYANAATAIAALHALDAVGGALDPKALFAAISAGLRLARVPARLQPAGGDPRLIVDVGHNPQAARALADWLDGAAGTRGCMRCTARCRTRTWPASSAALGERVASLASGRTGPGYAARHGRSAGWPRCCSRWCRRHGSTRMPTWPGRWPRRRPRRRAGDRILAFGSFFVASCGDGGNDRLRRRLNAGHRRAHGSRRGQV